MWSRLLGGAIASLLAFTSLVTSAPAPRLNIRTYYPDNGVVTFDGHSLSVHGERVILYSGEYHPFRQAVPGLWLDIFQKMRSAGYTAASFYVDWFLLEGEPGVFRQDGVFSITSFMAAAKQAGIYLIARPGPYINGETAGGGIPGWVQRVPGAPRTREGYQNASMNYWDNICKVLADGQVTKGGPLILVQIENEYVFASNQPLTFDPEYLQIYENHARAAGLVIPFSYNDITPPAANGMFAYGQGEGSVEVYGQDSYPLGFGCGSPTDWPPPGSGLGFPQNYALLHAQQSPLSPMAILEYQGGAIDGWAGYGYDACAQLVNGQAERLLYQTAVEFVTTVQSIYMTYGGTNWGNSGQPYGYTSYDYGAMIAEDRTIIREKYWNAKLVATMITSSPDYLSSFAINNTNQVYQYSLSYDLATAQAYNNVTGTRFFVVRHGDYTSYDSTGYTLSIPTSLGNITIPQSIHQIFLNGRDSKIQVVDYSVGNNVTLWYSSPDIFAYNADSSKSVLVVYGGYGEPQEMAFTNLDLSQPKMLEGSGITFSKYQNRTVLSWTDSPSRRVIDFGKVTLYILDRAGPANYWRLQVSSPEEPAFVSNQKPSVIIAGGYLIRNATVTGKTLSLVGDINATTDMEILAGMPKGMSRLLFNGQSVPFSKTATGSIAATIQYKPITLNLPNLETLNWKYINTLPELSLRYNDSKWPNANITKSPNDQYDQTTPTSLSSSDYGFSTGNLLYRGHFNATGNEKWFSIGTVGGMAWSSQVWINGVFIGYYSGNGYDIGPDTDNYTIPSINKGPNVITVLIDHMGMDEQPHVGNVQFKLVRGITSYQLDGHNATDVTWKLTGNLGGEQYLDKTRGPLNEGGIYYNRKGYHLPNAPTKSWKSGSPLTGLSQPGANFYYASFDLNLPTGYDIPLSVQFGNGTLSPGIWRAQLYINGWQFGRYIPCIGPQTTFPVPEGILNYQGTNYIGLGLWAMESSGNKVDSIQLVSDQLPVQSGYGTVPLVYGVPYAPRPQAY